MPTDKHLNKHHLKIVSNLRSKTGIDPRIIKVIMNRFFYGLNILMQRNKDIKLRGLFTILMAKYHRGKLKHPDQKYYARKNDKANYKRRKKQGYFKNKKINHKNYAANFRRKHRWPRSHI